MLLHAFIPSSRANGPGLRSVVFFQGCTLACRIASTLTATLLPVPTSRFPP